MIDTGSSYASCIRASLLKVDFVFTRTGSSSSPGNRSYFSEAGESILIVICPGDAMGVPENGSAIPL